MKTVVIGGGPGGLALGTKGLRPLVHPRHEMPGPKEAA